MNNKLLKSWGNLEVRNTSINNISNNKPSQLDIGNLNSYGDCCLPLQKISTIEKNPLVNETIFNYQMNNGFYLYGTPGKSNVTIGGAIASDTHGKDNSWGGSFYKNVKKLYLSIYDDEIEISKDKDSELFNATIGGYGLTGTIKNVELYKNDVTISETYRTFIETGFGIDNLLNSFNVKDKEFWVGWINLLDKSFPWVTKKSVSNNTKIKGVAQKNELEINTSFSFIGKNLFRSLNLVNKIYFQVNKSSNTKNISYHNTFFPLGFFTDTRNISKKRKIIQVQFSLPSLEAHLLEPLLTKLINKQTPVLCSIKRLSKQDSLNNLSFFQDGWTVAVDFSYFEFNKIEIEKFYEELAKCGGKIYLAKDSTLDEKNFKSMYPEFAEWEKVVKFADPKNLYQSNLSKRLGLKKW